MFPYFYEPYLVLIIMYPGSSGTGTHTWCLVDCKVYLRHVVYLAIRGVSRVETGERRVLLCTHLYTSLREVRCCGKREHLSLIHI